MGDLNTGDVLTTTSGKSVTVTSNSRQRAPPGETFSTYNFEVEDFHTYFVGQSGLWVHNEGKSKCEEMMSIVAAVERIHPTDLPFQRLVRLRDQLAKTPGTVDSETVGRTIADITQQMLDTYNGNVGQFPSVAVWKTEFFNPLKPTGIFKGFAQAGVDVHHSVEKYIQRQLGISDALEDTCPGIPMPRNKEILTRLNDGFDPANHLKSIHQGSVADNGLAGIMRHRIPVHPPLPDRQAIVDELYKIHTVDYPQYQNIWPLARDWLRDLQLHGFLEQSLRIP
jgi:hypothetical protein